MRPRETKPEPRGGVAPMARVELHPEPIALSQGDGGQTDRPGQRRRRPAVLIPAAPGGRVLHRRRPEGPGLERRPGDGAFARLCVSWGWPRTTSPRSAKRPQARGLPAYTTEDITAELSAPASDFRGAAGGDGAAAGQKSAPSQSCASCWSSTTIWPCPQRCCCC